MKKIDRTVMQETVFVFAFILIFSVLMEAVYLIIDKWDFPILWGNLLGAFAAGGNFFLLGLTVQSALGKDEKEAKNRMKLSQMMRMLMLFVVALIGYLVPVIDIVAVVIPFVFPRIAVALRYFFIKKKEGQN
ncbi:MAG: hypothetical protein IKM66_09875 [Clostridia bacterium]|nr:hypothetical protein [Clostridia bacterium]